MQAYPPWNSKRHCECNCKWNIQSHHQGSWQWVLFNISWWVMWYLSERTNVPHSSLCEQKLKFYLLRSKICKPAFPFSHIIDFFPFLHCFDHFIFIYIGIVITARLQIQHLKDFQVPNQTRNCHFLNQPKHQWLVLPCIAAFVIGLL